MSNAIKLALIAALTMICSVSIYVYFSPYQSCVRSFLAASDRGDAKDIFWANQTCARELSGTSQPLRIEHE